MSLNGLVASAQADSLKSQFQQEESAEKVLESFSREDLREGNYDQVSEGWS